MSGEAQAGPPRTEDRSPPSYLCLTLGSTFVSQTQSQSSAAHENCSEFFLLLPCRSCTRLLPNPDQVGVGR